MHFSRDKHSEDSRELEKRHQEGMFAVSKDMGMNIVFNYMKDLSRLVQDQHRE